MTETFLNYAGFAGLVSGFVGMSMMAVGFDRAGNWLGFGGAALTITSLAFLFCR